MSRQVPSERTLLLERATAAAAQAERAAKAERIVEEAYGSAAKAAEAKNYPTMYDGKTRERGLVFCTRREFVRYRGNPTNPSIHYGKNSTSTAGVISVYFWNQMSRDDRLDLLLLHWRHCPCEGFRPDRNDWVSENFPAGGMRTVNFRTYDLPSRSEHFSGDTTTYDTGEDSMEGLNYQPQPELFSLYTIAVHNPKDGAWAVAPQVITAQGSQSARNKAVDALSQNLPEGKTLAEALDEYVISVKGF